MVRLSLIFLTVVSLAGSPLTAESNVQKVIFEGAEKTRLAGLFIPPEKSHPTLILLHGLGSTKSEWTPLRELMTSLGWGVLAVDMRGHGESAPPPYQSFGRPHAGSNWEKMIDDVGRAIQFLEKEKGVERDSIYLGGASLGANVALNYAALSRSVKGVLLLSPGINYQGVRTDSAAAKIKETPVLMVVSKPDYYSYESCLTLKKSHPEFDLWTDVKDGHGVQMFDDNLLPRISEWLLKNP